MTDNAYVKFYLCLLNITKGYLETHLLLSDYAVFCALDFIFICHFIIHYKNCSCFLLLTIQTHRFHLVFHNRNLNHTGCSKPGLYNLVLCCHTICIHCSSHFDLLGYCVLQTKAKAKHSLFILSKELFCIFSFLFVFILPFKVITSTGKGYELPLGHC